jgi:hypothetical protein
LTSPLQTRLQISSPYPYHHPPPPPPPPPLCSERSSVEVSSKTFSFLFLTLRSNTHRRRAYASSSNHRVSPTPRNPHPTVGPSSSSHEHDTTDRHDRIPYVNNRYVHKRFFHFFPDVYTERMRRKPACEACFACSFTSQAAVEAWLSWRQGTERGLNTYSPSACELWRSCFSGIPSRPSPDLSLPSST